MGSSNVNTSFAKCYISFMATVTLLQGCAYLALALYGITQGSCSNAPTTDISKNPFGFIMQLIYFQRQACGNPEVTVAGLSNNIEIGMIWAQSNSITSRTNIILITYAAVSVLWIVTSLIVLVSICGTVTYIVAAISFWPWFVTVIGGSVLDGAATGYFAIDIIHTTVNYNEFLSTTICDIHHMFNGSLLTVNDTFEYIGADTTNATLMNILGNFDAYFVTPAVVMACMSSRLILIWLLNIFGTGFCLSLSRVLAKNNFVIAKTQQVADSLSGEQGSSEINNGNTELQTDQMQTNARPPSSTTYLNTDTHPDRLDYLGAHTGTSAASLTFEQASQLSIETPLNSRYAKSEFSVLPSQRVSAELRSQLPWSYTSTSGNTQAPQKPSKQVYPEIPEPDYNS